MTGKGNSQCSSREILDSLPRRLIWSPLSSPSCRFQDAALPHAGSSDVIATAGDDYRSSHGGTVRSEHREPAFTRRLQLQNLLQVQQRRDRAFVSMSPHSFVQPKTRNLRFALQSRGLSLPSVN